MDTPAPPVVRRAPDLSRRRALGLAVGAGAAALAVPAVGPAPVGAEGGRAPGFTATPARVVAGDAEAVTAEPLDPAQAPPEPWPVVPVAGFPWGLVPRVDDHVAVTDGFAGLALAAVPLCTWIDAIPTPAGSGYAVADRVTVPVEEILGDPAAALAAAADQGRTVSICLADTDRGDALVLQVREPGAPSEVPT